MFTGFIEKMGTIHTFRKAHGSVTVGIRPDGGQFNTTVGASIAISGVCLTVEKYSKQELFFTAVYETVSRSTLAIGAPGDRINLERALKIGDRLEGHWVLGHVDAVGLIESDSWIGNNLYRTIALPSDLSSFVAEKGSIAVDGISLTISDSQEARVTVALIPYTCDHTTMGLKKSGDSVNIECDVLSRYVGQHLHRGQSQHRVVGNDTTATVIDTALLNDDKHLQTLLEQGGF
ncbi:MAG: riboflavin synthase [Chitinivibrionales bacterium]|nr:riboflavin synthase [Chitinivibrionales bacterium]